jgi:hypothetical protein
MSEFVLGDRLGDVTAMSEDIGDSPPLYESIFERPVARHASLIDLFSDPFCTLLFEDDYRSVRFGEKKCTAHSFAEWANVQSFWLCGSTTQHRFWEFGRAILLLSTRLKGLRVDQETQAKLNCSSRIRVAVEGGERLWALLVDIIETSSDVMMGLYDKTDARAFILKIYSRVREGGDCDRFCHDVRMWNRGCFLRLLGTAGFRGPYL